jgi:hypothetical protein
MAPRAVGARYARMFYAIFAAFVVTMTPHANATAEEGKSLENSVKAAYLSKIGNYVSWPASAFQTATSTVNLCVAGDDPFGAILDKLAESQRVGDRQITVRRLTTVTRNPGCQILYIQGSDTQSVNQALDAVRGDGVLTVTDAARDDNATGIVRFVVKDNRVRFEIDDQAAALNGLTISSELLKLALVVKTRK